eukprot:TRINITY_DN12343_c0_g2_i1.p1 TRINITY_DN12343_c0_g2~~TRINITY_DN12343_c0_g2_i1.p1  ORF type:complete len:236 (-),score=55.20 TRINITY_DN12343_c0_g2_i1:42-749(-)
MCIRDSSTPRLANQTSTRQPRAERSGSRRGRGTSKPPRPTPSASGSGARATCRPTIGQLPRSDSCPQLQVGGVSTQTLRMGGSTQGKSAKQAPMPVGDEVEVDGGDERAGLMAQISSDILMTNPGVRFDDIVGLESTKRVLKEAVVMPAMFPDLFCGLLSPWRGVLLYGPPGTGKTMLAKAVATECRTSFFNSSAATMVSKYCLLYTSDAADEEDSVDLGGRRIIKKKNTHRISP